MRICEEVDFSISSQVVCLPGRPERESGVGTVTVLDDGPNSTERSEFFAANWFESNSPQKMVSSGRVARQGPVTSGG